MRGKMKMDLVDIQIFLFDHLIVFCKIKNQEGLECYKIYQKVFTKCYTQLTYMEKEADDPLLLLAYSN